MTTYVITFRVQTDRPESILSEGLDIALDEADIEAKGLTIRALKPKGKRVSKYQPKIDRWLKERHKPFHLATFADFLKMSKPSAHRRLELLVSAGAVTKKMGVDGRMEYEVYRPTARS